MADKFISSYLKRLFDLVTSVFAIVLLSPFIIILAVFVKIKLGSPVFFTQERPGKGGRPFKMYKFRTMTDKRDEKGSLLPDHERMTPFGTWLRSTSLDELPELFNVIRGEMSIVGPRPLLMKYLPRYSAEQYRRHEVKPGITGWAQVNGRNLIDWDRKLALDVWYVDNMSFWLDIKIIFLTVIHVFKRENVTQDGHVTVEEFMGPGKDSRLINNNDSPQDGQGRA